MNFRKLFLSLLIIILVFLVFLLGIKHGKDSKLEEENDKFSLEYINEGETEVKIRYRYELSFATAETLKLPEGWDSRENLFTLVKDDVEVASTKLENEKKPIIPEMSNPITLKPAQITEANFQMIANENIKDVEDFVRFESRVVIEELREKRWTPVYQVILMKRGKYWSLDKGPIEYLKKGE